MVRYPISRLGGGQPTRVTRPAPGTGCAGQSLVSAGRPAFSFKLRKPRMLRGLFRREAVSEDGTKDTLLSLPFPLFSKRAGTEGGGLAGGRTIRSAGKERRRTFALVSERLQLRNRSSCLFKRTEREYPAGVCQEAGGVCGLDGSAVFGSSPQPSGLPEPAGRFHRGATRGEVVVYDGSRYKPSLQTIEPC